MEVARFADENSGLQPVLHGKRSGGLQPSKGLGLGGVKQAQGGSAARRALGDISNRTKGGGEQPLGAKAEKQGHLTVQPSRSACAPASPQRSAAACASEAGESEPETSAWGSPEHFGTCRDEQRRQAEAAEERDIEATVSGVLGLRGTLPEDCYAEKPQVRSLFRLEDVRCIAAQTSNNIECHARSAALQVRPQFRALLEDDSLQREEVPPMSPSSLGARGC